MYHEYVTDLITYYSMSKDELIKNRDVLLVSLRATKYLLPYTAGHTFNDDLRNIAVYEEKISLIEKILSEMDDSYKKY